MIIEVPDALAQRLRAEAAARGEDVNNYAIAKRERLDEEVADDDLIDSLRQGIADEKAGRTVSLGEAESRVLAGLAARDAGTTRQC